VLLADAFLQPTARDFEYDYGPLSPTVHFVGALLPPSTAPRPGWWGDLDGGRRLVLATQGTFANLEFGEVVEPTLAALAGRDDLLVIVTTGGRPVENVRGPIPANARLARFLDYEALMPRLDLLVTNSGYGTVSLALRADVPIVSAGLAEDKAEVSARIAWSGVGVHLASKAVGVEAAREGVERVLGGSTYRERARAMASSFSEVDTRREIFSILDRLVAEGTGMRGRNGAGVMTA
jgi:UDP:flavonoid glycosyltransferase YjiC (YdhE family)